MATAAISSSASQSQIKQLATQIHMNGPMEQATDFAMGFFMGIEGKGAKNCVADLTDLKVVEKDFHGQMKDVMEGTADWLIVVGASIEMFGQVWSLDDDCHISDYAIFIATKLTSPVSWIAIAKNYAKHATRVNKYISRFIGGMSLMKMDQSGRALGNIIRILLGM